MLHKARLPRHSSGRLIFIIGFGSLLAALLIGGVASAAPVSGYQIGDQDHFAGPALQGMVTPTPTLESRATPTATLQSAVAIPFSAQAGSVPAFSISLAELGYDEIVLDSPSDQFQYPFRLPENWAVQGDGILELDLSYAYDQISPGEYPATFGELIVKLDGQSLKTIAIAGEIKDSFQQQIPMPVSLLNNPDRTRHVLEFKFDTGLICEIPHRARLVIHPKSSISLDYSQRPLVLDLSRYPRPFYQQSFDPDVVRVVLPSQPTVLDLSNSAGVAAKLGDLTGRGVVISATMDAQLISLVESPSATVDEHLFVIGQPQHNRLLPLLNEEVDLPVSLHQGRLGLAAHGPATVSPGETFDYTFVVTNTTDQSANLSLVDPLPPYAELVSCTGDCVENDESTIIWSEKQLAPDETIDLSLTLRASDVLTGTALENVVTLLDADFGPMNTATLTASVVSEPSGEEVQTVVSTVGDYFFVHEGKAVAHGDGVVQEILSPWNEDRAILIITGLSEEAVRLASQAMSSEAYFPGMSGSVALVQDALTRSELDVTTPAVVEATLSDLGYSDQMIRGGGAARQIDYFFQVPYGWELTEDAAIDVYFGHSERIDYENSGLTVLLNNQPLASAAFSEETAADGHLRVGLTSVELRRGGTDRLTLEVDLSMPGVCADDEQAWFLAKDDSRIFLAHRDGDGLNLDLDYFPYPFHMNPALTDLTFVLPAGPTVDEIESVLNLAASLGNSAAGKSVAPIVIMDSGLESQDLEDVQLIAIGRPSRNLAIQQVNADLPQPFLPGSDEIDQKLDDVVFRLPPGVNLGYLQLVPSPWNETRAFLAVTGTTDQGIDWAVDVLTNSRWALGSGNLALVRDEAVNTIDTRELTSAGAASAVTGAVPEMVAEATQATEATATIAATPLPQSSTTDLQRLSNEKERPEWLIPLVAATGVVILVIFVIAFWQARRERP